MSGAKSLGLGVGPDDGLGMSVWLLGGGALWGHWAGSGSLGGWVLGVGTQLCLLVKFPW